MSLPKPYYQDSAVTLYHGDCREIVPLLGRFDLLLTDPPYGHDYASNHGASWSGTVIENDSDTSVRDEIISMCRGMPMAVFGSWKRPRLECRQLLIWNKGPAFGMGDLSFPWKNSFEEIYIIGDGWEGKRDEAVISGHIQVSWESKGREHPNQKPVTLLTYLLSKHNAKTVLDPFAGSGTTGRACKDLGRKCVMIEREEKYCEIAAKRCRQEVFTFNEGAPHA